MKQDKIKNIKNSIKEERKLMLELAYRLMENGVKIRDPNRLDIRGDLTCGSNVEIDINVVFEGNVNLGKNVIIESNCILNNSYIGDYSIIKSNSIVEHAEIGIDSSVGPYGRIRQGTKLGDHVQIGNFVEIKNSKVGSSCRINHLSFVGDADLEENVTLGASTITCNHDGVGINKITIGKGAYIGSGCNLVAPITIGAHATVGSGSTITENVPGDKLSLARSNQVTIENWKGPKHRRENKKT